MDLISRQDAIDALGEEPEVWYADDEYSIGARDQWRMSKAQIDALPSAQQWIPCSECKHCDSEFFCHAFKGLGRRVKADEYCSTAEWKGEQE